MKAIHAAVEQGLHQGVLTVEGPVDLVEGSVELRFRGRIAAVKQGVDSLQAGMDEPFRRRVCTVRCAVVGIQEGVWSAVVERLERGMVLGILGGIVVVVLAVGG